MALDVRQFGFNISDRELAANLLPGHPKSIPLVYTHLRGDHEAIAFVHITQPKLLTKPNSPPLAPHIFRGSTEVIKRTSAPFCI